MKSFTRRSVIKGALVWSASAAFAIEPPRATFPVDPRARIAVATYPFRESIIAPGNQDREPQETRYGPGHIRTFCADGIWGARD